jgi:hypothetical protein
VRPDRLFIDNGCIKVHRCAGGARALGSRYRGRNSKLLSVCGTKGRPLSLLTTLGNVHDREVVQRFIKAMSPSAELVTDKGYGESALAGMLRGAWHRVNCSATQAMQIQYDYGKTTSSVTSLIACFVAPKNGVALLPVRSQHRILYERLRSHRRHPVAVAKPDPNENSAGVWQLRRGHLVGNDRAEMTVTASSVPAIEWHCITSRSAI